MISGSNFRAVVKVRVSVERDEVDRGVSRTSSFHSALFCVKHEEQRIDTLLRRQKTALMKSVRAYKPSCTEATDARVLLLGPVGSGKSSFISSVQSVFNGRVTNRAMVGSFSTSFTKKVSIKEADLHSGSGFPSDRFMLGPATVLQNPRPERRAA